MTLQDTATLMVSSDYKERFQAEYYQLAIRSDGLARMLTKYRDGTLEFTPTCPIEVLEEQNEVMKHLLMILEARATLEGIPLEEV